MQGAPCCGGGDLCAAHGAVLPSPVPRPGPGHTPGRSRPRPRARRAVARAHLLAVLRLGEVDEVVVVHLLGADDIAVLLLAQVLRVDAVGPQELLVGHAEGLANGLRDQLGLRGRRPGDRHGAGHAGPAAGQGPQEQLGRTCCRPAHAPPRATRGSPTAACARWGLARTALSSRHPRTKLRVKKALGKLRIICSTSCVCCFCGSLYCIFFPPM